MPQSRTVRYPRRLVVKLADGSTVNGQPPATFTQQLTQLRVQYPDLGAVTPLFDGNRWASIYDRQKEAIAADPSYQPVDFSSYWRILLGASVPAGPVLHSLHRFQSVVFAYVDPAGTGPADPDFGVLAHFAAAPAGVTLEAAWPVGAVGARGQGVTIGDLERGWDVNHAEFGGLLPSDLMTGLPEVIHGTPQLVDEDREHGCNVLGILMAQEDGVHIQGAADLAAYVHLYSYVGTDGYENVAEAVMSAALTLDAGDVLLLEVQATDDAEYPAFENRPVEIAPAVFAAIRLATALGITVVEPCGNDAADLDLPVSGGGSWTVFDREDPDFEDSGALVVAASTRHYGGTLKRFSASNHGNRVDLFAVGENVSTTSRKAAGYDMISGTSPAAAVIAGVAASVQSAALAAGGARYSAAQLRWLLGAAGFSTGSHAPDTDGIGRMPDLAAIYAGDKLPTSPDVFLRDHVGDSGAVHGGALSSSPDVILRQEKVADPEASFGAASGTMEDYAVHQDAVAGATHWLYVRASERGGAAAANAVVDLWWAKPATLIYPSDWTHIGQTAIALVPAGGVGVSEGLEWNTVPDPGHYCFLAIAAHPADPAPAVPDFGAISAAGYDAWDAFKSFLRVQNNATWRNFNVLAAPTEGGASTSGEEHFLVRGAPDRARKMRVVLRFLGGPGASVGVKVSEGFWDAVEAKDRPAGAVRTRHGMELEVAAGAELALTALLPPRSEHEFVLRWKMSADGARGAQFCAIQSEVVDVPVAGSTTELGRVSWIWQVPHRSGRPTETVTHAAVRPARTAVRADGPRAEPVVRGARPADRAAIRDLLQSSGLDAEVSEDLAEFVVAEVDGLLAGCAAAEVHGEDALLRSVAAVPGQREYGLGARLTETALAHASARGARTAWMLTETSQRYFQRRGFETQERAVAPDWLRTHHQWRTQCSTEATVMRRDSVRPDALFVYGTLRSGSAVPAAQRLHSGARSLGSAWLRGALLQLGSYPGLVESSSGEVEGELFLLPQPSEQQERLLAELDAYESTGPGRAQALPFRREVRVARRADGNTLACWVYLWRGEAGSL